MISKKVLVICDDPAVAIGLTYFLKGNGYLVDVARESAEGLAICKNAFPNLILIRYSPMGNPPDALTLCRILRKDLHFRDIPIFVISNAHDAAVNAGATEWFDIVFDVSDIAQKMKAYIG